MDKYIRKLDAELSRFEQELQLKDPTVGRPSLSSISDMQPSSLPRTYVCIMYICVFSVSFVHTYNNYVAVTGRNEH